MNSNNIECQLSKNLLSTYGPLLGGRDLAKVLGYKSLVSLRKAVNSKKTPIPTFTIQNRRGHFALTLDVIAWLLLERNKAILAKEDEKM